MSKCMQAVRYFVLAALFVSILGQTESARAQDPPEQQGTHEEPAAERARELTILRVQNAKAWELAEVISKICRDVELQLAVDERTNSILAQGTEKTLQRVGALVEALDIEAERDAVPGDAARAKPRRRLIFYWLATGPDFQTDHSMPQQLQPIVEELNRLGIENVQLASRSIAALDGDTAAFESTVDVADRTYRLSFHAQLGETDLDGRPRPSPLLKVEIHAAQVLPTTYPPEKGDSTARLGTPSSLQTTITAPPDHYVVLGTTGLGQLENAFVIQIQTVEPAQEEKAAVTDEE